MDRKQRNTRMVKDEAARLGFDFVGISKAGFLKDEAPRLEKWLKDGMHGEMSYMERNFDKRLDPRKLMDGATTVISLMLNYYPEGDPDPGTPKVSRYAWGKDYHFVIKDKLAELLTFIKKNIGNIQARAFVDSAPVLDRAWAKQSGLGWIGKNSNLINPKAGSYFFLAELICDLELEHDSTIKDHCGTCSRCIDACPTQAIIKPYVVDGSKCISYFTIELKNEIPSSFNDQFDEWIFGCDVCQEVCPWNRFSLPTKVQDFSPINSINKMSYSEWEEITEDVFNKIFAASPLKRSGFDGLKKNLNFILKRDEKPPK